MSRNKVYKPGDLIRSNAKGNTINDFKSGQVVEVIRMGGWDRCPGYVMAKPIGAKTEYAQSLRLTSVKLAKQAMLEREAHNLLRAGNIPKARNKTPVANRMRRIIAEYANRRG